MKCVFIGVATAIGVAIVIALAVSILIWKLGDKG